MNEWKYPQKHCILELKGTYGSFSPNPNFTAAETEVQGSNTKCLRKSSVVVGGPSCGRDGLRQNTALSSAICVSLG